MKLSVIIPVYNEVENIEEILKRVKATKRAAEIIVVDDGSQDGTRDLLKKLDGTLALPLRFASGTIVAGSAREGRVRVILREKNQGKGAAIRTGLDAAAGDILLIQDADLEYDPRDYPALLQPLEEGIADVVYGCVFWAGRGGQPCSGT